MNKFKAFFTFFAFAWLLISGIGAFIPLIGSAATSEKIAWMGVIVNALALPIWMGLRFLLPEKIHGDLRESPAFAAVLLGLALALLADNALGLPIYLVITNVFVFLLYLYHLSAVSHPAMPGINDDFPELESSDGHIWRVSGKCAADKLAGAYVVFLRGSYCADSRSQLIQLRKLLPELKKRNIGLFLWSVQPESTWSKTLLLSSPGSNGDGLRVLRLSASSDFVARQAAPLVVYPWVADAVRPSAWLVDASGTILWRALSGNYRTPAGADLLRAQWFRLQD